MLGDTKMIELQMSGKSTVFGRGELNSMLDLAEKGVRELIAAQKAAL